MTKRFRSDTKLMREYGEQRTPRLRKTDTITTKDGRIYADNNYDDDRL